MAANACFRDSDNGQTLCARCASLDMDEILSQSPKNWWEGRLLFRIEQKRSELLKSLCSFCRLITSVTPASTIESESEEFGLCIFQRNGRTCSFKEYGPTLGVVRMTDRDWRQDESIRATGCLLSISPPDSKANPGKIRGRLIDPRRVDFKLLRHWIACCRAHHQASCSQGDHVRPAIFNLIDCKTMKIVSAPPNCRYSALSYVCGPATSNDNSGVPGDCVPEDLPRTIRDAIKVTKELDLRYVWIDKYCIYQDDEMKRHIQIRQMDLVYKSADVTIIAAGGRDPRFGLPGVSETPRTPQPSSTVGRHLMVSMMPDPETIIESSTYVTRGWTYQESLFSCRRLVFTEQQVYFECQTTSFCETFESNTTDISTASHIFNSVQDSRKYPWYLLERLAVYSTRKLSFETDILIAFLGALRDYEDAENPIYHHWGVPMLPAIARDANYDVRRDHILLTKQTASEGFVAGLCWLNAARGKRRYGFPSWSWTGWDVPLQQTSPTYRHGLAFDEGPVEVSVELRDGSTLSWQNFCESYLGVESLEDLFKLSQYIHVQAWTIPLRFLHFPPLVCKVPAQGFGHSKNYWAVFKDEHQTVYSYLFLLPQVDEETIECDLASPSCQPLFGIIPGTPQDSNTRAIPPIIVVKQKENYFERIGHLFLGPYSWVETAGRGIESSGFLDMSPEEEERWVGRWVRQKEIRRIRLG